MQAHGHTCAFAHAHAHAHHRRGETLNNTQREAIYKLFVQYESVKINRGDWDLMDVVWHIHKRAGGGQGAVGVGPAAAKFQEIYVDEVGMQPGCIRWACRVHWVGMQPGCFGWACGLPGCNGWAARVHRVVMQSALGGHAGTFVREG